MASVSVSIDVPDLGAATAFYVEALGCEKLRDEAPNMTVPSAGNLHVYLLEKPPGSNPPPTGDSVRTYTRHWTPVHLDFGVQDVADSVAKVLKAGGSHEGGDSGAWGEIAYCADPYGNGFDLIRE